MLITPGATAYLLTDRLSVMILISSSIGFVSSVVGLYVSFAYNVASGASIVIVMSIIFMATLIMSPKYGILKLGQKTAEKLNYFKWGDYDANSCNGRLFRMYI